MIAFQTLLQVLCFVHAPFLLYHECTINQYNLGGFESYWIALPFDPIQNKWV